MWRGELPALSPRTVGAPLIGRRSDSRRRQACTGRSAAASARLACKHEVLCRSALRDIESLSEMLKDRDIQLSSLTT